MITIKEAKTKRELKTFIKFPFSLYKDSPYYVPPLILQELRTFNKNVNPVFKNADAMFFLAYKKDKLVGRVAAIINWLEVEGQGIKKMRFGWFDFIDDLEVSKALLDKVVEIGESKQLDFIEGPVGFSNLDKVGVMTDGFDQMGSLITWYNDPYYAKHYEHYGMVVAKPYLESKFAYADVKPETFLKAQTLIKRRYKLKALNFESSKEIMPYTDEMFDVFIKSHQGLATFVDINEEQRIYFKKKFINFLNPEYVKFVLDENDKIIAFAIVSPSYAGALRKMKGKLFPFGLRHLMHAKKHNKIATFYLIGILPEYQGKGVTSIIFDEYHKTFNKKGVIECLRGPELEENTAIHQIWKHFNPYVYKRRCTYKKQIA